MFKINIGENLEQIVDNNLLTGSISISVNGRCFPDECWDDFIETILIEWTNEVCGDNEYKRIGKLIFFDGPYLMMYEVYDSVISLYCTSYDEGFALDYIPAERNGLFFQVDFCDFLTELQCAIRILIEKLASQPIPHDTANLSSASRKLASITNSGM